MFRALCDSGFTVGGRRSAVGRLCKRMMRRQLCWVGCWWWLVCRLRWCRSSWWPS